jgi:hypothetical protein
MAEEDFQLSAGETETANEAATEAAKLKKKSRSPNYPMIGLEKALERARTLQIQAGRHFMPVGTAHTLWNYKKGAGDQTVAALRYFGLLEVQGEKEGRQVRVTDMARRILGDAPDRDELLKVAALKPDLHKEIWEKYEGELPASDQIIRGYLVWDRNFNENFVDDFIAQFRGTIAYAKLVLSDSIRDEEGGEGEEEAPEEEQRMSFTPEPSVGTPRGKQPPPPPLPHGHRDFPLYLTNHQKGILHVPAEMSYRDYELLQKQIENHMAIILVTSVVEPDEEKPDSKEE